jgi:hypothetical protein
VKGRASDLPPDGFLHRSLDIVHLVACGRGLNSPDHKMKKIHDDFGIHPEKDGNRSHEKKGDTHREGRVLHRIHVQMRLQGSEKYLLHGAEGVTDGQQDGHLHGKQEIGPESFGPGGQFLVFSALFSTFSSS